MVTSVLLIVLGAVVYYLADQFPQVGGEGVTGPDLFPKALAILLICLSLLLLVTAMISKDPEKVLVWGKGPAKSYITVGMIVIYFVVLQLIGFFMSTPVFLFVMIRFLGQKSDVKNIAVSLGVTLIIYVVSNSLLYVPLPTGILFG